MSPSTTSTVFFNTSRDGEEMALTSPRVPVPSGHGPPPPTRFCTPREQPCSPHLAWGRGITSSAAPWHKSNCKIPASRPEERPAGGKLMGEPSAKSPSRELVGRARALLFTEPAVLFLLHQGKGREEEASLATKKKNPKTLGFCSSNVLVWDGAVGDFWEMTSRCSHGKDSAGPWVPHVSVHVSLPCHLLLPSIICFF